MNNLNKNWFEVWYVPGVYVIPSYLVVVTPDVKNLGEVVVLDISKNEIIYRGKNYETVYDWLIEDEFCFVESRILVE